MSQQKLKNYENRTKPDENNVEEFVSSQTKRQFGVSSQNKGVLSSSQQQPQGLKQQFNSQKDDQKLQKPTLLTPQKRTESAVGLTYHSESKKQNARKIEQTYRHREQEIEWTPEGLDLDFSPFESNAAELSYEQKDSMFMDDVDSDIFSTTTQRRFTVAQDEIEMETPAVASLNRVEQEEPVIEIQHDTSTVEYGPPREIEIPFEPHKSCIVDFDHFSGYADLDGYELPRLFDKDNLEFVFDDVDAIQLVTFDPIDNDALVFAYDYDTDNEIEMFFEDDLDIPFNNYQFDVDHFIQSNPAILT